MSEEQLSACCVQVALLVAWGTLGDTGTPSAFEHLSSSIEAVAFVATGCLCSITFGVGTSPVLFLSTFTHVCSLTDGHSFPRLAARQKLWCLS